VRIYYQRMFVMESPCQKIVWNVLPAIRAAIAAELVRCGMSQVEAARVLEMAPSAVSQYLSGKRGYRIEFDDEVKKAIGQLAQDLQNKKDLNLVERTCGICRQLRGEEESPCSGASALGEQCR
jgi:predicted transcriptional regulator